MDLVARVAKQIREAKYRPTRILAMANGGFMIVPLLSEAFSVSSDSIVGVPITKDFVYRIADWFEPLMPAIVGDQTVLVFDDSSRTGRLISGVATDCVEKYGAKDARTCVLIASSTGIMCDFVGTMCEGEPPKFTLASPNFDTAHKLHCRP